MSLWLESDGAQVFSAQRLFCLTSFHRLIWAENRIYWWCLWTSALTPSHPHPNYWHKAGDERTNNHLDTKETIFLIFKRVDISQCSLRRKHTVAASLGETEDPLACVSSTVKRCLPLLLLAESPVLFLTPRPYQAGPSHRLECKHTAVAQGGLCLGSAGSKS